MLPTNPAPLSLFFTGIKLVSVHRIVYKSPILYSTHLLHRAVRVQNIHDLLLLQGLAIFIGETFTTNLHEDVFLSLVLVSTLYSREKET